MILMKLREYILTTARDALENQNTSGAMPAGHNGPWNHQDTPIRTTAHWAQSFYYTYKQTNEDAFKYASIKACDYLLKDEARPFNDVYVCRNGKVNHRSNGLIGQAWAVEPLLKIGNGIGREDYLKVAVEVLKRHPFDELRHGWHNIDIGGVDLGFCTTLN